MIIKDGKTGFTSAVNGENMLTTWATNFPYGVKKSIDGEVFIASSNRLTVTTTRGLMMYLINSSADKNVYIDNFQIFNNGGSTNYNRPIYVDYEIGLTAPTTNTTTLTAGNANTLSSQTFNGIGYQWDEVGTGMTGHTQGFPYAAHIFAPGYTPFEMDGFVIIGPGISAGIYVQGVETGEFSVAIRFIQSELTETDF